MSKKKYGLLTSTAAIAFILAACGGGNGDTTDTSAGVDNSGNGEETTDGVVEFESGVTHDGDIQDGGTLRVAMVTDSPFQGLFSQELYEDGYDAELMQFNIESLFGTDENFQIDDTGNAIK